MSAERKSMSHAVRYWAIAAREQPSAQEGVETAPENMDVLVAELIVALQHAEQALALLTSFREPSECGDYSRTVQRGVIAHERVKAAMSSVGAGPLKSLIHIAAVRGGA